MNDNGHDSDAQKQDLFVRKLSFVFIVAIFSLPHIRQHSREGAALSSVVLLCLVGGLMLWDEDRARKEELAPGPFWLHVAALELGLLSGWLAEYVQLRSEWFWHALLLQSLQMLFFFVLLELSTQRRARKGGAYALPFISCLCAHMLMGSRPLFDPRMQYVDGFALAILGSGLIASSVNYFHSELETGPLQRRYVYAWVFVSNAVILCWRLLVAA